MANVWEFLDDEYGKTSEVCADRISYLQKFAYSSNAKTAAQKFKEMYKCFNEVYNDMRKI